MIFVDGIAYKAVNYIDTLLYDFLRKEQIFVKDVSLPNWDDDLSGSTLLVGSFRG